MARIEHIERRLKNWAEWKAREAGGGLGFPKKSSFLREAVDTTPQAHTPIDEAEASITNEAVAAFAKHSPTHHRTLAAYYLAGIGTAKIAQRMGKDVDTVARHLLCADMFIRDWLEARPSATAAPARTLAQLRLDKRAEAERAAQAQRDLVEAEERKQAEKEARQVAAKAKRAEAARARRARNQKKSFTT